MVRNSMMEDIRKYYVQDKWFEVPYKNLQKRAKPMKKSKSK
jgi:hypothetical protein